MKVITFALVLCSTLMFAQPAVSADDAAMNTVAVTQDMLDINTASAAQMAKQLNGIGKSKAEAIVAFREANGPFKSVSELTKVPGVGKKTLEANSGIIAVGESVN